MTQQGELFGPKPQTQDSGEGKWCVAVAYGKEWRSVGRDYLFVDAAAANEWAFTHPYEIMGRQWRVCLLEDLLR